MSLMSVKEKWPRDFIQLALPGKTREKCIMSATCGGGGSADLYSASRQNVTQNDYGFRAAFSPHQP